MAAAVFAASLIASLWFAWDGPHSLFLTTYGMAWVIIAAAWLFLAGGNHGSHGSPSYMVAWGLAFLFPFMIFAALLIGFLAFIAGAVGARRRAMIKEEADR